MTFQEVSFLFFGLLASAGLLIIFLLIRDGSTTGIENLVWENQSSESYKPYDVRYTKDGVEKFVEVKGMPSNSKEIFKLSQAEWIFIFSRKEDYSIYRLYSAGKSEAEIRLEILHNPSELVKTGAILPNPIVLQI